MENLTGTTYTSPDLVSCDRYEFQVRATNSEGDSIFSGYWLGRWSRAFFRAKNALGDSVYSNTVTLMAGS